MVKRRTSTILVALATLVGFAGPVLADDIVNGSTGPGSVYRFVRPTNWNGILVLPCRLPRGGSV